MASSRLSISEDRPASISCAARRTVLAAGTAGSGEGPRGGHGCACVRAWVWRAGDSDSGRREPQYKSKKYKDTDGGRREPQWEQQRSGNSSGGCDSGDIRGVSLYFYFYFIHPDTFILILLHPDSGDIRGVSGCAAHESRRNPRNAPLPKVPLTLSSEPTRPHDTTKRQGRSPHLRLIVLVTEQAVRLGEVPLEQLGIVLELG